MDDIHVTVRDRRVHERFKLDAAVGSLVYQGHRFRCQFLDISLSGCRLHCESRFTPGSLAHVRLTIPIHGMVLQVRGTTQWTVQDRLIGVRFFYETVGQRDLLASLLTCLVDRSAEEVVRSAISEETAAQSGTAILSSELRDIRSKASNDPALPRPDPEGKAPVATLQAPEVPVLENRSGIQNEKGNDWHAVIRSLKDGRHLAGFVVDLNLEACTVRIAKPNTLGNLQRVELDFQVRGLPFRMAGVIESMREKQVVQIRFLELSNRKQKELAQLISELSEPTA